MPRLKPLTPAEAPEAARKFLADAERALGEPSVPAGIQARCPPILEAGRMLGASLARSNRLPAELRGLVCIRVAQMIGCPF